MKAAPLLGEINFTPSRDRQNLRPTYRDADISFRCDLQNAATAMLEDKQAGGVLEGNQGLGREGSHAAHQHQELDGGP